MGIRPAPSRSTRRGVFRASPRVYWRRRDVLPGKRPPTTEQAAVAFAGEGTLGVAAAADRPAAAAFSGAGAFSATATATTPATVAFAGAGQLMATPGQVAAAAFAGSGQMSAAARQTHQAAAAFAGSGALGAAAQSTQVAAAAFAGTGSLTVAGTPIRPAAAAFTGAGQMLTDGRRVHPATWAAAGAGALLGDTVRTRPGVAAFTGAGRMQVTARADRPGLNVSMWAVTGSGVLAPLPAFEQLELSRERNGVGSVSVRYPAAAPGFGHLRAAVDQDRPVEVEVWFGGGRSDALRALLTQTSGDDLSGRAVWSFTGTFLEQILDDAVIYPQPAPAERGELRFDAKNAGEVVATVLGQAQARGVLAGVTRDWTTSLDSSGQPWPSTISGLRYSPRTTLLTVLLDLVEKDFCEFELTRDRVLRLWAPDRRGTNRTAGVDPTLFRYGRVTSSPLRHSTRDTVTAVLAIGADGLSATASDTAAQTRIGRRVEVGVDANNIADQGALTAYAQAALASLTRGQEEIRHPLTFGPGDPRPKAGYDLADKVLSERKGGTRRAVDVQQWTLTADRQRVTGGEVILNDLIASRLQRLARQVRRITSGAAVIGTSEPPEQEDTLAPAAPTGLVADSIAYQDDEHSQTLAAVTLSWAPVTTNADGTAADDVTGYKVQYAYLGLSQVGGIPSSNPEGTLLNWYEATPSTGVSGPPVTFGGIEAGARVGLRVAAFDNSGNQGAWSSVLEIDTASDNTPPEQAAAPTLAVWFRTIDITSSGLDINGAPMPVDYDHDEIWISRAATFTVPTEASTPAAFDPAATGPQHVANLFGPGTWNQPDIPVGVGYYAARRSVDRSNNPGALSPIAGPVTAEQLVQIDIGPNAIGRQQIIDLEVVNAKIANAAINSLKVEEINVGLLTAGTMTATVTNSGLFRTAASGNRVEFDSSGIRLYMGSTIVGRWQTSDASMLMTGTYQSALSGERINIFPDGTMRFYPASGTNYSQIANFGNDLMIRGVLDANNRSGRINANALGVGLNFSAESEIPSNLRSEIVVLDRRTRITAPFQALEINGKLSNPVGGARRIQFSETDGSGNSIAASFLSYQTSSTGVGGFTGNGGGIKFEAGQTLVTTGGLDSFGVIKASDFVVSSSETVKEAIEDIRAVVDPLAAVRAARARKFVYADERWYTPPPTMQDPDPVPVAVEPPQRFGVLAEELPDQLVFDSPDGSGGEVPSISIPAQVGVLWGAVGQIAEDMQIRYVHASRSFAPLLSLIWPAGSTQDIALTWDETPLDRVRGADARLDVGVAWLGKLTARVLQETVTDQGCTVRVTVVSPGAVTLSLTNPLTVHAVAAYLYTPPYVPEV